LAEQLRAAAAAEKRLPKGIAEGIDRVKLLQEKIAMARIAHPSVLEQDRKEAHRLEALAWRGLHSRIVAFQRLPVETGGEARATAQAIIDAIFSDGLRFLTLPYVESWSDAEHRLKIIENRKLAGSIRELAGDVFLDNIKDAHAHAGRGLVLTQSQIVKEESLSEHVKAFADGVREYVVRVCAHADEHTPEAEALADRLLAPLIQWKDRRAPAEIEEEETEPTSGTPPSAPPAPPAPVGT
jgi:hypothetical protein